MAAPLKLLLNIPFLYALYLLSSISILRGVCFASLTVGYRDIIQLYIYAPGRKPMHWLILPILANENTIQLTL